MVFFFFLLLAVYTLHHHHRPEHWDDAVDGPSVPPFIFRHCNLVIVGCLVTNYRTPRPGDYDRETWSIKKNKK